MRVVVTGTSGMVGAAVEALLLARGADVLRPEPDRGLPVWEDPVTGARETDFATPEYAAWIREVRPEAVIHAGAVTSSHRSALLGARRTARSNVSGQISVAEAARDVRAFTVLFGSDSMFDPEDFPGGLRVRPGGRTRYGPRTMYGVTKLAGHLAARDVLRGTSTAVLYPSFGWGGPRDGMTMLSALVRAAAGVPGYGRLPRLQLDPERRKGITHHGDVARLAVGVLVHSVSGEFAAAGHPEDALPFGEVADLVRRLSGAALPLEWAPELDYKGDMLYHPEEVWRAWDAVREQPSRLPRTVGEELRQAARVPPDRLHTWTGMETLADAAGLPPAASPGVPR